MTDRTQEPSLTERLAAKLRGQLEYIIGDPWSVSDIIEALPLLLSEPELVASLPDEVRLSVLTPRERAVMKLGEATARKFATWDVVESRRDLGFDLAEDAEYQAAMVANSKADEDEFAALEEVKALTPEGKDA